MTEAPATLRDLIERQTARPVQAQIAALADAARALHEGAQGKGVLAVLAYGSTLRGVDIAESLADLYVLTEDFGAVSSHPLARIGCRLAPPNVHYLQLEHEGRTLRAKYACLPLAQFARWMQGDTANPYFWARFAQPCRIVWSRDEQAREATIAALAQAVRTMCATARALAGPGAHWRKAWEKALAATYGTELRPEGAGRAGDIVAHNAWWCEQTFRLTRDDPPAAAINWRWRRISGKAWSVIRLTKAAFTFTGGADYIAWKIERHSGVPVKLSPWQRRHPLLAAIWLAPRLLRKGAFR